jgi:hypothetical protein
MLSIAAISHYILILLHHYIIKVIRMLLFMSPSLLLAFAHIHGEAGTPTLGICSAVVGRNDPFYVQKGWISIYM